MAIEEALARRLPQRPRHGVTAGGTLVLDPAAAAQNVSERERAWATIASVAAMERKQRRVVFRRLAKEQGAAAVRQLKRDIETYRAHAPSD